MKRADHPRLPPTLCAAVCVAWFAATAPVSGQLAITEVMSGATTDSATGKPFPDFWELTNFGTNTIALDDYRFSDDRGVDIIGNNAALFSGKQIAPGESIVFVRTVADGVQTPAQFRAWWGEANLPLNLQIYFYSAPGFNNAGDAVQLFRLTGTSTTRVDYVRLFEAREGFTFTYDPESGVFSTFSVAGVHGAFKAAESSDVGSPGVTTGPVALRIVGHPQDVTVDAGNDAMFSVEHVGLPRPRFQWRFNGHPISGATSNTLLLATAVATNAGTYSVELDNGLVRVVSSNGTLVVNTNPSCARISQPPSGITVYTNQTAVFRVVAQGYPLPFFQWQLNGTDISGATNSTLFISNVTGAAAGTYLVRASNYLCSTTATAHLSVTPKPFLRITEAMAHASTNTSVPGHGDWWELTNFDTVPINLRRYRFNDYPGPSLEGTLVISNDVVIQPGESILFVRQMSPEAFKNWWGEENLPENVQILSYSSHNFDPGGDAIFFWNAAALEAADQVTSVNFVNFTPGVSLFFDPFDEISGTYGEESMLGQRGAIRALESDDIGSPGYITNHPPRVHRPRFTEARRTDAGVRLTWTTRPGKTYELLSAEAPTPAAVWTALGQHSATGLLLSVEVARGDIAQRFYRVRVLP